jgi:hypothetical protein
MQWDRFEIEQESEVNPRFPNFIEKYLETGIIGSERRDTTIYMLLSS